jgi:IS30 family transposase
MGLGPTLTTAERNEIYRRVAAGQRPAAVARAVGRPRQTVSYVLRQLHGIGPQWSIRSDRFLSLAEREEISRGLRGHESLRSIGRRLGRAPSTISREVARNRGERAYRAWSAERAAARRARRPKPAKLATNAPLRTAVEAMLEKRWSPEQIARRLRHEYPAQPEMWVSHETIYQSLFVQGRGALREELRRSLRTGRARRRPQHHAPGIGEIRDMVLISDRPAEVEDRAVPGHWEGDLLMGKQSKSAIATLVERQTRFVMLVKVEAQTAEAVRTALARQLLTLPEQLRRTITWDRGWEMSEHVKFTVATGVQVYFCDPRSPWQRGSNENTNGLLRQYFPRGTDLSVFSQTELDDVARELNDRPRQTLGWLKPCEVFAKVVASTA